MPMYTPPAIPGLTVTNGNVRINDNSLDRDFTVEGDGFSSLLHVNAGNDRIGIGNSDPQATLYVNPSGTFMATRLLAVTNTDMNNPALQLLEVNHAGRYLIYTRSNGTLTLPSASNAGEHYTILNATGGDITIARNGNDINGATNDFTLGTYKAATCIGIGSNNWIVVG